MGQGNEINFNRVLRVPTRNIQLEPRVGTRETRFKSVYFLGVVV